jgi:hypothetical protein
MHCPICGKGVADMLSNTFSRLNRVEMEYFEGRGIEVG